MDIYGDDAEIPDIHMFQRVVGMFERQRRFQRIITYGLLGMEFEEDLDDTADDDDDDDDSWAHGCNNNFHRYPKHSPLHYYSSVDELPSLPPVTDGAKENYTERRGRLVQETKQSKAKAEKKRLKKQKQRRKKQLEKLEREKRNPTKNKEEKTDREQSKAGESEASNDKTEDDTNSSVKQSAAAKDTGSSNCSEAESSDEDSDSNDDSCDSEELDMTSTFVTKAALIANRKSAQRPKQERKEKKKTVIKEVKTVPDKPNEDPEPEKKEPAAPSTPTLEENIKISTELAVIGNKFAGSGDFNMAVKYFTDAIKYNPTEFKLFGNRSFCFEKMREYEKALTDAELCLNINPGWVKGLFRKGRALAGLKRYEEAAQSFREVLQLDSSYAEAAQELMRVQITQLMAYGFTREQSSNALIIHGTVKKALEVLYKLHGQPGAVQSVSLPPAQVVNVTGVSPVLGANTNSGPNAASAAAPRPPQSHVVPKPSFMNKPLGPVHNMSNVLSQQNPVHNQATKHGNENGQKPTELFPVWVGNLFHPVEESVLTNVFKEAGVVYSVKILSVKRCAFVNYTKQEHCDEAIQRFHGYELEGNKIAVRYPDRIPQGIGISKSALKADENVRQNAVGSRRPIRTYRQADSYNN